MMQQAIPYQYCYNPYVGSHARVHNEKHIFIVLL
jgi:hypothetical protein